MTHDPHIPKGENPPPPAELRERLEAGAATERRAEVWARFAAGGLAHGKSPSLAVKDADATLEAYDERFPERAS